MADGFLTDYKKGNTYCYNYYGISYWTPEDCDALREDIETVWNEPGGRDVFYEQVPLVLREDNYNVQIHECQKGDVVEIDTFADLVALDPHYKGYKAKSV